jgi:predicted P-loop ATPase
VGRLSLIASVRRVRQPGCKFDYCPVIEGPQRAGKSTVLKHLGKGYKSEGGFFSDTPVIHASFERQVERTQGIWVLEFGELNGLKRVDNNAVKNFLSSGEAGGVRAAYERVSDDYPRQFVPWGTTNDKNYLADQTGNTRYWPIVAGVTGKIDIGWIQQNVDQLWAEAAVAEAAGESIELDPALYEAAAVEQEARRETDPWEHTLTSIEALADKAANPADEILKDIARGQIEIGNHGGLYRVRTEALLSFLGISVDRRHRQHELRLGEVMRVLGWDGPKQVWFPENKAADGTVIRKSFGAKGYTKPSGKPDNGTA